MTILDFLTLASKNQMSWVNSSASSHRDNWMGLILLDDRCVKLLCVPQSTRINFYTLPRYLSCSMDTKSKIVTSIRTRGLVAGEMDVDSHTRNAFQRKDCDSLEKCAEMVG